MQYTQSFVAVKIASMSDVFSCDAECARSQHGPCASKKLCL